MHPDHKRIAKNTGLLYIRMILTLLISLYTSRVVLMSLGVTDYGIYNVVGGVVVMMAFLNNSLDIASQRFLCVELGRGDQDSLQRTFSTSLNIHIIMGIGVVLILETVGLWFVMTKLDIPASQYDDALWVYQCSIATLFLTIFSTPYTAIIIAHERMSIFAILSLTESVLKLVVALAIMYFPNGRLKIYGILMLLVATIVRGIYYLISRRLFEECKYRLVIDLQLMRRMFTFSGWTLCGTLSDLLATQGVNILINIFFGPVLNAARAIAVQVQNAIFQFTNGFLVSVHPQIMKLFSAGDRTSAFTLASTTSKLAFFMMMLIVIPLSIHTQYIFEIWLDTVPEYASLFVNLILIEYMIRVLWMPISQINEAYGNIKLFQICISSLFALTFVLTYFLYRMHMPVYSTFILSIIIAAISIFVRLIILRIQTGFPLGQYIREVMLPAVGIFIFASIPPRLFSAMFSESFVNLCTTTAVSLATSCFLIWFLGLKKTERIFVRQAINKFIAKFNSHNK